MLDMKLYPIFFNKEVLGYNNMGMTMDNEGSSAVRYKTELTLLKKFLKLSGIKFEYNLKNYCLENKMVILNNTKEYCQVVSSLEDNDVILSNAYKSGDEFNFFNLSAFYISNKELMTFWNIEFLGYHHFIMGKLECLYALLDEILNYDYFMDDFLPAFFDTESYPWNCIINDDFKSFYEELNERYSINNMNSEIIIELEECVHSISSCWDMIPTDELRDLLYEDLQFTSDDFFNADYSEAIIIKYELPIAKEFNEFIFNNDIKHDELIDRAAFLVKFLDKDSCFYSRSFFSEDCCWAYPYENYDIRINMYLMEVDTIFQKLNKKYNFSKKKPTHCKCFV